MGARHRRHAFHHGVDFILRVGAVFQPGRVSRLDLGPDLLDGKKVLVLQH